MTQDPAEQLIHKNEMLEAEVRALRGEIKLLKKELNIYHIGIKNLKVWINREIGTETDHGEGGGEYPLD